MTEPPNDTRPTFWSSLGVIANALASDLGRAIAVLARWLWGFRHSASRPMAVQTRGYS